MSMNFNTIIYINGEKHRCTGVDASFYADCEGHPYVPCSCHNIGASAAAALKRGRAVRTLGNTYSLTPPRSVASLDENPWADPVANIQAPPMRTEGMLPRTLEEAFGPGAKLDVPESAPGRLQALGTALGAVLRWLATVWVLFLAGLGAVALVVLTANLLFPELFL